MTSRRRSGSDEEGRSLGSFVSVVSPAAPGQGTVTGRGRTLEDPSAPHRRHVATGEVDLDRDGGVTGEAGADEPGDPTSIRAGKSTFSALVREVHWSLKKRFHPAP